MSDNDRVITLLSDWLEDQPARAPDQLLDAVISDLKVTPQRGRWRIALRRLPMFGSNPLRFSMGIAAVALAAVLGFALWGGQPAVTGPVGQPSPSPSQVVTPAPSPSATATGAPWPRTWEVAGFGEPTPFFVKATIDVPSPLWDVQYSSGGTMAGLWAKSQAAIMGLSRFVRPFEDPCALPLAMVDVGPSVDDLVDALANAPVQVSAVTETLVDGYPAWQMTFTAPPSREGCEDGHFFLWRWANGFNHGVAPGDETTAWVVDVEGTRVLIAAGTGPDTTPQEAAELRQAIDSITLEPPEDTAP
jgi:hypothetical protein